MPTIPSPLVSAVGRRQSGTSLPGLLALAFAAVVTAVVSAVLVGTLAVLLANDRLPTLDALMDYRPRIPLRVYTADNVLIGEFGEERRTFVHFADVPQVLKDALLAAEDARFFEHSGVDLVGVARAALVNLVAGGTEQGASTLTMQLAREFFLSPERTYTRKLTEILLAFKIEDNLTKEQIFELYINQIFLGKRAYGFASAAQTYFGKPLEKITAAEAAMLAGLPKAPSRFNPLVNPKRAVERQRYILRRMRDAGALTEAQYQEALKQEMRYAVASSGYHTTAPYVAEMARQIAVERFHDEAYSAGINVHTTILSADQQAANEAVRQGVLAYDRKYGYRGPSGFIDLDKDSERADAQIEAAVSEAIDVDDFLAAVVVDVNSRKVTVSRGRGKLIEISGDGLKFVANSLSDRASAARRLRRGAIVRVIKDNRGRWEITQLPQVEAALVALNTRDGSVRALVGGFDFTRNKFNRVTQAWRQPGSAFKPFIYSAALEKGFMVSTVVNDAPVTIDPALTGGQLWDPRNYDGKYEGPMDLRTGLAHSKNMVSIRVLQSIGPRYAQDYLSRFGFDPARHPPYLTMALGAGEVTPWQLAGAYSVFANGGFRVEPYIVSRITDAEGRVLAQANPAHAGEEALRAIDSRNAFLMDSLLRSVVQTGTGRSALALGRSDLAGKTGTTNDSFDAWFAGYQPSVAAVAWVGYDQPRKLGDRETGGGLALPIWMGYMGKALARIPEEALPVPEGVVRIGNDYYYAETTPGQGIASLGLTDGGVSSGANAETIRDQLF